MITVGLRTSHMTIGKRLLCLRLSILLMAGYFSAVWSHSYAETKTLRSAADQSQYQFINDTELAT